MHACGRSGPRGDTLFSAGDNLGRVMAIFKTRRFHWGIGRFFSTAKPQTPVSPLWVIVRPNFTPRKTFHSVPRGIRNFLRALCPVRCDWNSFGTTMT